MTATRTSIERRVAAGCILVGLVAMAHLVLTWRALEGSQRASDQVNHAHAVILEADAVVSSLNALQAGLLAYLLSADARDLRGVREIQAEFLEHVEVTRALVRSVPERTATMTQLAERSQAVVDGVTGLVQARANRGAEEVVRQMERGTLAEQRGEIRKIVERLAEDQKALLQQRDRESWRRAQTTRWWIGVGTGLIVLLLGVLTVLVRDDLKVRGEAARALSQVNAELDEEVEVRTADLRRANETLQLENLERRWALEALEHQLRYSQAMIHSLRDPVFMVTRALNVVRANPAAEELVGARGGRLLGAPLGSWLRWVDSGPEHPSSADGLDPLAGALRLDRELQAEPGRWISENGRTSDVRVSAYPVRDSGKVVGAVVTVRPA